MTPDYRPHAGWRARGAPMGNPSLGATGNGNIALDGWLRQIDEKITGFLDIKSADADFRPVIGHIRDFFANSGKRIRPLLCMIGWEAAGATGDPRQALSVSAALEMFHSFALIHDDIMDASDYRRGRPTMHRVFAAEATAGRGEESAALYGTGLAILLGDLLLVWSDELVFNAELTSRQVQSVMPLLNSMRREIMIGQYLDLTSSGRKYSEVL
jgi:geranylgeranyl diphosphate synthase, type I